MTQVTTMQAVQKCGLPVWHPVRRDVSTAAVEGDRVLFFIVADSEEHDHRYNKHNQNKGHVTVAVVFVCLSDHNSWFHTSHMYIGLRLLLIGVVVASLARQTFDAGRSGYPTVSGS